MLLLLVLCSLAFAQKECLQGRDKGESCGEPSGQRFFFDEHTKRCQPFYYKGCGGNGNNFKTREECQKKCSDVKGGAATAIDAVCKSGAYAAGATSLAKPLSCSECPKGYQCEGEVCCPKKEYLCNLQYDAGKFGDQGSHRPRYFYSKSFKNCMLFTYYGRDGNANNFETYNECKAMCMS
ncbi:Kunitz/Bovine pancreatic trypsin inhibitor domain protein [Ancylostoma ceylanicum]|uniref:Kunitz/Bovine pancreatic trypsin inhibitor domain protein n=2 Tax=Ancylostoma ceylanicum TaxID=53326 RepID=A0A0D6LXC2_9BILA|nr:Kunitz/Bovine pancreatic trypsin inhibitor domain protein [Ancylostoma ceylanicum]EYC19447.1 hypothetical protein Y032_0024g1083 [Ancylostoma ceylanicum]